MPAKRPRFRRPLSFESLESRETMAADSEFLRATEVEFLLDRAAAATSSDDAIIAIVDRGGRILGVRVEQDVLDNFDFDGTASSTR